MIGTNTRVEELEKATKRGALQRGGPAAAARREGARKRRPQLQKQCKEKLRGLYACRNMDSSMIIASRDGCFASPLRGENIKMTLIQ